MDRGAGGRRFYRVRVRIDDSTDPVETEEPADTLTLVARAPARSRNGRRGKRAGEQPDNEDAFDVLRKL